MQDPEGTDRVVRTKTRLEEALVRHVQEHDERVWHRSGSVFVVSIIIIISIPRASPAGLKLVLSRFYC